MDINKLRGAIYSKYRSQSAFAASIEWHVNKVSRMMQGKYIPDIDEARLISDKLSLDARKMCDIFLTSPSPNGEKR